MGLMPDNCWGWLLKMALPLIAEDEALAKVSTLARILIDSLEETAQKFIIRG